MLKAVGESARAPGRVGKALRALAPDFSVVSPDYARLLYWASTADIDDRFHALLSLYEQFRADEELRAQILGDFEGKPLLKSVIKQKLREIDRSSAYQLHPSRAALRAHDRLRLLAQFFRAAGGQGLVVFFDELERVAKFPIKQRMAVYEELGWWREQAEQPGSGILPVFAMTDAFLGGSVTGGTNDQQRFATAAPGQTPHERDRRALRGIEMLKPPSAHFLDSPTPAEEETIKERVQRLYERAYSVPVSPLPANPFGVRTSVRSEIRRWITQWDLARYYPDYAPQMVADEIDFDAAEISESELASEETEGAA